MDANALGDAERAAQIAEAHSVVPRPRWTHMRNFEYRWTHMRDFEYRWTHMRLVTCLNLDGRTCAWLTEFRWTHMRDQVSLDGRTCAW